MSRSSRFACALFGAFFLLPWIARAQWEDVSLDHLVLTSTVSSWFGAGISTVDFNLDGWDDVTASGSDGTVKMFAGGPDGLTLIETIPHDDEAKAALWVDIENDGDLDLLVGVLNEGVYLYVRLDNGELVEQGSQRGIPLIPNWDPRGISAADYDGDLDLDLYVASYHDPASPLPQENILLQNDGGGYFSDVTTEAGVGNGLKHSFQGSWFDWDEDGDQDLWVINDRSVYPNALYRNLGNGTFHDVSVDVGANIGIEAMSATLWDPDNDGDWDMYCTNIEDNPNVFLRNDNGVYVDATDNAGLASMQYGWGACAVDVNGDMLEDLMVATYRFPNSNPYDNHLYMNMGGGVFVDMIEDWPNEQYQLYCLGRLDLDGDHTPDIIGHGNSTHAQVLHNTNSEGAARLSVSLVGTTSNAFAIGAVIEVFAGGTSQVHQVTAGCDYMTQHTFKQFFGLGESAVVDSLTIRWPAGLVETYHDLPINSGLTFIEGTSDAALSLETGSCAWSPVEVVFPFADGAADLTWNGESVSGSGTWVDSSGTYVFEAMFWGNHFWTDTVDIEVAPTPTSVLEPIDAACHGEPGFLHWSSPEAQAVVFYGDSLLSEGEGMQVPPGEHAWIWVYGEDCTVQESFVVAQPEVLESSVDVVHPACFGEWGTVEATVSGGTPPYSLDWNGVDAGQVPAGPVMLSVSDSMGCALSLELVVEEPPLLTSQLSVDYPALGDSAYVSLSIEGGTPPYSVQWSGDLDDMGWVLAPASIAWLVQDANGCLDIGAVQIESNPMAATPVTGGEPWSCLRIGQLLKLDGDLTVDGEVEVYGLDGRLLGHWKALTLPVELQLNTRSPVLVHMKATLGGQSRVWIR